MLANALESTQFTCIISMLDNLIENNKAQEKQNINRETLAVYQEDIKGEVKKCRNDLNSNVDQLKNALTKIYHKLHDKTNANEESPTKVQKAIVLLQDLLEKEKEKTERMYVKIEKVENCLELINSTILAIKEQHTKADKEEKIILLLEKIDNRIQLLEDKIAQNNLK